MLFNSYVFIFIFLPVSLLGCYCLNKKNDTQRKIWLISCSLFFYAYWNPYFISFILVTLFINFIFARLIATNQTNKKYWLLSGILFNLILLGYFKYHNFFIKIIECATHSTYESKNIILPLAISFISFQQIAFLVDEHKQTSKYKAVDYVLFILFFPQLIAGPIVYFKNMVSQFNQKFQFIPSWNTLSIGIPLFAMGLFKKVILADTFSLYADPIFIMSSESLSLTFIEVWGGALCYAFQLYFDFSGYSDMALGIAKMFGITLPINFNSPYQALNIIDFWRRWHITLSNFLKNYLYIPLGGNRKGTLNTYRNLIITMLLGGLWHGAGFNFILWGALHGIALSINHYWRNICTYLDLKLDTNLAYRFFCKYLTFIFVVFAWVFFRAESSSQAFEIIKTMLGFSGIVIPENYVTILEKLNLSHLLCFKYSVNNLPLFRGSHELTLILIGFLMTTYFTNTYKIVDKFEIKLHNVKASKLMLSIYALLFSFIFYISLLKLNHLQSFLYYQF